MKLCYKYRIVLFLIALCLTLTTCNKDKNKYNITGTIIDNITQSPVANASVSLAVQEIEDGVWHVNYHDLLATITDNSGFFSFTFDVAYYSGYKITITKDQYFNVVQELDPDQIKSGEEYQESFEIIPEAYLKLDIRNVSPLSNNDRLTYHIEGAFPVGMGCCKDTLGTLTGTNVNYTQTCRLYGNTFVGVHWNVIKNDTTDYSETVLCEPFDTTIVDIFY